MTGSGRGVTVASRYRRQAESLEREMRVVCLVLKHHRAPWYCKGIAAGAAGYQLSPITLIPDWVPVIGFLDNLLVLGLGIWLVEKLTPTPVVLECRRSVSAHSHEAEASRPRFATVALVAVVALKMVLALLATGAALALLKSTLSGG